MFKSLAIFCSIAALSIGVAHSAPLLHGDILVTDTPGNFIYLVDRLTGRRTIFSGAGAGTGPSFDNVRGISQAINGLLYVANLDPNGGTVIEVDPTTGNRRLVSGNGIGSGVNFGIPFDTVVSASGEIFVLDRRPANHTPQQYTSAAIFRIDPVTGDRTIISSDPINAVSRGSGPTMASSTNDIDILPTGELVVAAGSHANLLKIDPTTGDRQILSGDGQVGTGDDFVEVTRSFVVANETTIYTFIQTEEKLVEVDILTGDRKIISENTGFLRGLNVDLDGNLLLLRPIINIFAKYDLNSNSFVQIGSGFRQSQDVLVYQTASPIPEPATSFIMLLGIIGLAGARRYV